MTDREREELFKWLESQGWVKSTIPLAYSCDHFWYRQYKDVRPGCYGNEDKEGIQVCLKCWDASSHSHSGLSFQVEITAEPDDGEWVELTAYGLCGMELRKKLDSQVQKILRAWQAVQTPEEQ